MNPSKKNLSQIYQKLETDPIQGLTSMQAQERLQRIGKNKLLAEKSPSIFYIFFTQFADPLIYLLLSAAGIIFFIGQSLDAFIISGILVFNAIIGTIQEKRTENILQSLQTLFSCDSIVVRDGIPQIIANLQLVPGDIIRVTAGDKIPADARIITAINLSLDESMLTGESHPIDKSTQEIENNSKTAQQTNILFSGTHVISGQATAVVFATGNKTEAGKIHRSIESINTSTPLKKELETLAHWILLFVFAICSSLFVIGLVTHKPIIDLLTMLTALFICIVPEGLPVVMTLVLISGAYKMAQCNILIKNLQALEALGRVNVIITDKTGTLTRNEMVVSSVFVDGIALTVSGSGYFTQGSVENQDEHIPVLNAIAQTCTILNDTTLEFQPQTNTFTLHGDPTQAAAFIFAQKIAGKTDVLNNIQLHYTIPFDSSYRYKAAFYTHNESSIVSVLGAPEVILAACDNNSEQINLQLQNYLAQGFRVVAVAQKIYTHEPNASFADRQKIAISNLTFLGLLAISDEPRENLRTIIQQVHDAGIQIIMATGDHPETAAYVAQKVGITNHEKKLVTGQEFAQLSDQQAIDLLHDNIVCARFTPKDKLRLVQLLHQQKKVVATTGDGINDVPALVASDVSIAMGSTGTHLTKQASDIILLQDSFENIVYAIQQGRSMFFALRRTVLYFLTSNMGEVLIVFFALIMNLPLPLLPAQILWLNLITDGFLDVALAMEPNHETTLLKNSSKKNHRPSHFQSFAQTSGKIFDTAIIYKMFYLSLPMSLIGLITFISMYQIDIALARTLTLVTLAMFQWFNALNCRSETKSIFQIGLFSNYWLIIATAAVFSLQFIVIYTPFMQHIFKTVPLTFNHWIYAITASSSVLVIEELRKFMVRRF
ncbi:MAG: HAD-IC family P-type ATPase [Candidatus Chromulinivorax sp.]|nr:HAD-IC family P-type ATPase [Candidatus Chromulinivorax sp.]